MSKKHTGLWLPNFILLNADLDARERLLLAEVHALQGANGCYASNAHLGRIVGVKDRRLREMLTDLCNRTYLRITGRGGKKRRIFLGPLAVAQSGADKAETSLLQQYDQHLPTRQQDAVCEAANSEIKPAIMEAVPGASQRLDPAEKDAETRQAPATENTGDNKGKEQEKRTERRWEYDLPLWLPARAWRDWYDYNASQGRPLTDLPAQAQIRVLDGLRNEGWQPEVIITEAIANGWKSFYPPRNRQPKPEPFWRSAMRTDPRFAAEKREEDSRMAIAA